MHLNNLMILEGVVTTVDEDGECHIAPMGPVTDIAISKLLLRPFNSSKTYQNLKQKRCGVFHITDDVLLMAKLIVKANDIQLDLSSPEKIKGYVLNSCCRWYEFQVVSINDDSDRTEIEAEVLHSGTKREFLGFNRAKHAVIEAAILASRIHILAGRDIQDRMLHLKEPVQKTAGDQETEAFRLLEQYINEQLELKARDE